MTHDASALRYEIKFNAHVSEYDSMAAWLQVHPCGFFANYPARIINNLYFDNPSYDSYWENLVGISSRSKVRLRWYGDATQSLGKAFLEIKFKKSRMGWKHIAAIDMGGRKINSLSHAELLKIVREPLDPEMAAYLDMSPMPVLMNSYEREYFLSADHRIRATLDKDLRFYHCHHDPSGGVGSLALGPDIAVMEFKFGLDDIDRAKQALHSVRYQPTKNSKFVMGILACTGK
ncbi:MAG: polyphosphate polymerase domain-containing protein [Bdellovibrionales bacterium]